MTVMNHIRIGRGKPLLLLHGLGGSWRSWRSIIDPLAVHREVIAVDLPGFGKTPPLPGEVSIPTLARAVTEFMAALDLTGTDVVGSSMGARLVLELARRGVVGAAVSLDPGGFWRGWERSVFRNSIAASIRLVRALQPVMLMFTSNPVGRTLLFPQFSPRPWDLSAAYTLDEMRSYAAARSFDTLLDSLAYGPVQRGAPPGTLKHPVTIGWGRQDRVCFPAQAARALASFPDARLHWFESCGHFPHWDQPEQTVRLILANTGLAVGRAVSASG